jgi:bifunctional DNase/RNase
MLNMKVLGLTLDEANHAPVLILQGEAEEEFLPICIGAMEAMAISLALGRIPVERPLTHDLLLALLHSLEVRLSGVELVALRKGTYYADLVLSLKGGEIRRIDCRPSDAVALALRADVPIRANRELLFRGESERRSGAEEAAETPEENGEERRLSRLLLSLEPESKRRM